MTGIAGHLPASAKEERARVLPLTTTPLRMTSRIEFAEPPYEMLSIEWPRVIVLIAALVAGYLPIAREASSDGQHSSCS